MDWYFCTVNLSILLNLVFAFYFYLYSLDFFSEWFQSDVLIRNFNFSFWNFVFIFIERNYKRFSLELEKNIFFIKKSFRFNEWLYNIQSTQKLHINCIWYILLILHSLNVSFCHRVKIVQLRFRNRRISLFIAISTISLIFKPENPRRLKHFYPKRSFSIKFFRNTGNSGIMLSLESPNEKILCPTRILRKINNFEPRLKTMSLKFWSLNECGQFISRRNF